MHCALFTDRNALSVNMEPDRVRKIMFLLKGSFVRFQHAEFSCDCKFGLQLMHSHVPLFVL